MNPFESRIEDVKKLIAEVPARIASRYCIFPLAKEKGRLQLAIPPDLVRSAQEEIYVLLGKEIDFHLMPKQEIRQCLLDFYGLSAEVVETLAQNQPGPAETPEEDTIDLRQNEDASISRLVNDLILDALSKRASDIHIEPFENVLRVRYRIDGLLHETKMGEKIKVLAPHLISRIKVLAKLDIGEKRLPQDGRIKIRSASAEIDLRLSVLPSFYGEALAIRILKPLELLSLQELGFEDSSRDEIQKLLKKAYGMILLTGPTGSGKTTTLYSCLKILNQVERKIITIEDPIEYQIPGVLQMQVNTKTGFTFASALRSILRHDPDCIMVGEIRDTETVKMAFQSALTGHLVFSTLHTNDAASALTRLLEMGLEPHLIASVLEAVIAQRLVRKFCPLCKGEKSGGCPQCQGTGFYGRTVIYEILILNEALRDSMTRNRSGSFLRRQAAEQGMLTFRDCARQKLEGKITSPEEMERVISPE